jgi:hypothetical protein
MPVLARESTVKYKSFMLMKNLLPGIIFYYNF